MKRINQQDAVALREIHRSISHAASLYESLSDETKALFIARKADAWTVEAYLLNAEYFVNDVRDENDIGD